MLLESALADFSTDDSRFCGGQPGTVPFQWEAMPGKPKSPSKGVPNSDAGPMEIKHVYHLDLKLPPSRQFSGELSRSQSRRAASEQTESPRFKVHHSRQLSSSLEKSRSPPPLDVNLGSGSGSSTPKHRSLTSVADEDLLQGSMSFKGEELAVPFVWEAEPGRSKGPLPALRVCLSPNSGSSSPTHRILNSGADENVLTDSMSFRGEAGAVPFTWEAHPGKPKLKKDSSFHQVQLQLPPARVISMLVKERDVSASASPRSLGRSSSKKQQQQQQGRSSIPQSKDVPTQQSKFRLGNVIQVKKPDSFNSPAPRRKNHSKIDTDSRGSMNSEIKYYEEDSPVSTLERMPSPPSTNSSGSSGSLVRSPRTGPAEPLPRESPVPGLALARRRLPSFSSSSAQSSPRASTSSSTRYMGNCLVALQAALAVDPEKSKRFEDSFVELDTYVEGAPSRSYTKSPLERDLERSDHGSSGWARAAAHSELEPEYNTMDFYSENGDDHKSTVSSSSASSLARSYSGSSTTSIISRPIRRSVNAPRVSVDEYSVKDKRFLSDHPSSWVQHGDDSISSSLTNSKCSTLTRHQDVSWDDQQADLNSERAEEVVRGAIDGLRFTYSPVSSAFVFTRPNEGDEEAAADPNVYSHSPHNTTYSEASRRFSISLDYATSVCSEDSHSFARGSDVTELGVSRAESWSKVARGIAFQQAQQGYQDALPSSFLRRAGIAPLYEDASTLSPEFQPRALVDDADTRIIRKRPSKKSGMTTCLPFRSILRNFKTIGSPGRSRLGLSTNDCDRPLNWNSPAISRLAY